ncbi:MAG: DUF5686 and carboxypeptidase regulatory-like domain-containing protein [Sphingobacteriales bacterium]|nr:DUF5686 and carboxypeptidase regulatory-like domain-containing protein [Sphingobacteriales bacterium]
MRNLLLLFSFGLSYVCNGQHAIIKGTVESENKEPLPYASVYIKSLNLSTTSNNNGDFQLKVPEGRHELSCHYIGFKPKTITTTVALNETRSVLFSLQPEQYKLSEVQINATTEDPAYPIMRQAIARRGLYRYEAKEFACRVYLKGMQRLTKAPKRVMLIKVPEDIKPGVIYLSESLSDLQFQIPDKIKEKLISSKVSGDNRAFSFNRAGAIKFSLYEPTINSFGLSERGFVSPLSGQAFTMYKFKLEGESEENGQVIYKIKLIPKRNHDPVFRGYIYIVKNSWRLHSTDLLVNKDAGVEFVDTLYIKQQYTPQSNGVWMPSSQRFIFQFEAFGFKGNGYFVASYSNYNVNPNYPAVFYHKEQKAIAENNPPPQIKKVKTIMWKKELKKQDSSLFSKKHFNNELLNIDKTANKTPDSLWDAVRPVPLTDEEKADYKEKDSIQTVHESQTYLDSMDRVENKPEIFGVLFTGYTYTNSYRKTYFTIEPPPSIIQFNTVEGWVLNPKLTYERKLEDNTSYSILAQARYGFASSAWYGKVGASWNFDAIKESRLGFEAGNFIAQFNSNEPISPFINSAYTLAGEVNYMKLYEKAFLNINYTSEVANGVRLNIKAEYANRSNLYNRTHYSFAGEKYERFTSNQPINMELPNGQFDAHRAILLDLRLRLTFAQKYISRPDMKIDFRSKYPYVFIGYKKGFGIESTSPDFDELSFSSYYSLDLGLLGFADIRAGVGMFMNNKRTYLMDKHHFEGNQTIFSLRGFRGYQLLPYYQYSTSRQIAQAFYSHHFNGFFINKIPMLRKLRWQEVVAVNYLHTPDLAHYIEWGAGIEHIFKIIRVDYYQSYISGNYLMQGMRIGFGF